MSRDGRYVLFASTAANLVFLGTNGAVPALIPAPLNVFLRDRAKGLTVLVSVNLDGSGGGNGDSMPVGVSTNGRYALFESSASNLAPGDTNNASDVFLRDLLSGTTVLVSANTNGLAADNSSYHSTMTPDGRYVAFASAADDLVAGDTNGIPDVFVRDLAGNTTTLASVGAQNRASPFSNVGSAAPQLTPDGRYVAFYSTAGNLVPGASSFGELYVRDRLSGTTTWASSAALATLRTLGPITNALSFNAALSDDGRYVAFETTAFSYNPAAAILRFDSQTAQTVLIDTNAAVPAGMNYEDVQDLSMTPDGRFVAYVANLPDRPDITTAIHRWDAQSASNSLVSGDLSGSVADASSSDSPVLSDDGRYVAFVSSTPGLVTNDIPGDFHMYLRDVREGLTTLVDADTNGIGSSVDPVTTPALSFDGRFVAFDCQDGDLVPGDRNRSYDVFLRDVTNATTELISSHDPGLPSDTPDGPSNISISSSTSDGRLVLFWSEADDLVANDTNAFRDIFLRDTLTGTNSLVSANTNGVAADGLSTDPTISADGQYAAFTSLADDIVSGDTNNASDVFIVSLQQRVTRLVSINAAGTGPGNSSSYLPTLSSNGQFVLFRSRAGNLAPGMTSGAENLFLRDLQNQATYALTTKGVLDAAMTPDGRFVAYLTLGSLYVWSTQTHSNVFGLTAAGFSSLAISPDGRLLAYPARIALTQQLFIADWAASTNAAVVSSGYAFAAPIQFSSDGRFLTYSLVAQRGVAAQVYLYDSQTGTNFLLSQAYDGSDQGDFDSDSPAISSDGRFVAYRSAATNLVPGDTNGVPDIFLYDRLSGSTTLVSANRAATASADNRSLIPVFSGDGHTLFFVSWASDLISDDFNNDADIFALALNGTSPSPSFVVQVLPGGGATARASLSWPVVPGKTYRVQLKNSLTDPVWQNLANPFSVLGNRAYLKDGDASTGQRFYRVLAY